MAYTIAGWQVDLWREAREFIRTLAILSGESKQIDEARNLCKRLTQEIDCWDACNEDNWEFDK
jgi:hypothetical protein